MLVWSDRHLMMQSSKGLQGLQRDIEKKQYKSLYV